MNLSWMFGNSLEAHHLLYSYLTVWLVQGGYACWIGWRWLKAKRTSVPLDPDGLR